jgi:hypothetical protein
VPVFILIPSLLACSILPPPHTSLYHHCGALTANYPEYLGKCHMINVPWVFTSMWFFIKGLLDEL